ncbi:MAG TPA: ABC transporter ATP-binding protein, partial [Pseudomonadota bacterium]|nr:ABC transporter ATP-binding protein [Pseudomonadota bacterium]
SRSEIRARIDDILAFAEISDFVDMPVRYYSSGMLARLGFSVAIHTDPDLLLVDEVLAVGDYAFQQKCIAKIQEIQRTGTSILFVSHDAQIVRSLCDRVLWLCEGQLRLDGSPTTVVDEYVRWAGQAA